MDRGRGPTELDDVQVDEHLDQPVPSWGSARVQPRTNAVVSPGTTRVDRVLAKTSATNAARKVGAESGDGEFIQLGIQRNRGFP